MTSAANASRPKSRGFVTMGVLAALLSAASEPTPKTLLRLTDTGLPDIAARLALHVLPVLLIVGALAGGRALGRGRTKTTRWAIYAALGAIAGFCTAFCLDLLSGVPKAIESVNGPLSEPGAIEVALWALGALMLFGAAMLFAVAALGASAAYAINVEEDIDPEAFDVRKRERQTYGVSSAGLIATGIAIIALAVARQSGDAAVLVPTIVAVVSAMAAIILNLLLWNGFDELQRQQVARGYAVSAVLATLATFVWAILEVMRLVPPIDGAAAFLIIVCSQFIVTALTTATASSHSTFAKPA